MNPDETWVDNSGQQYYYDPVLARNNPSEIGDALADFASRTELAMDAYNLYTELSGGRQIPGPIGTVLVASTAAYDNRHESPDRILFEVVAYVVVDAAVDTYASVYALTTAAATTNVTGNPAVGALMGSVTFVGIQVRFDAVYGNRVDKEIDALYNNTQAYFESLSQRFLGQDG
jgi:hypothetical protein